MKKTILLFLFTFFIHHTNIAQKINPTDLKAFQQKEDSLKKYAEIILQGLTYLERETADSLFTRTLVRSLKTSQSFHYAFDSLISISRQYAPDSSFRIFTWQLMINENKFKHHGAIQMKTDDGSLKLYPLFDKSDEMKNLEDTITSNNAWVGAIYYRIVQKKIDKNNFYSLLGFDEYGIESSRKIIDVLHFEQGKPLFGGSFFSIPNDSIIAKNHNRFIMEYKKGAGPKLNYDEELDMIVKEHLISQTKEPEKKWTLVGDGDYDGLKWIKGKWVFINKIFKEVTIEGNAPIPLPIKDSPENSVDKKKKKKQQ